MTNEYHLKYLISEETVKFIRDTEGDIGLDDYCRTVICEELSRRLKPNLVYSVSSANNGTREIKCFINIAAIVSNWHSTKEQDNMPIINFKKEFAEVMK